MRNNRDGELRDSSAILNFFLRPAIRWPVCRERKSSWQQKNSRSQLEQARVGVMTSPVVRLSVWWEFFFADQPETDRRRWPGSVQSASSSGERFARTIHRSHLSETQQTTAEHPDATRSLHRSPEIQSRCQTICCVHHSHHSLSCQAGRA